MDKLRELQQRLNELVKQLRDAQGAEHPDGAKVDALGTEIRSLAAKIETERAIMRTQGEIEPESRSPASEPKSPESLSADEYRQTLLRYARGDTAAAKELRDMTSGMTSGGDTGGFLIPPEWEKSMIELMREQFVMRSVSDVQQSASERIIPLEVSPGEASWIDEGKKYNESDAEFFPARMGAHKAGRIVKVSEELLLDNRYDLQGYLTRAFAYSIGVAQEDAFVSGDGTGKPTGFLKDAAIGTTAAAPNKITYEELLDLYKSLKNQYDRAARWMLNKNTLVELMKLKDGAGQYIWRVSQLPGELGHILGAPVTLNSFMPDIGAAKTPIAYGDFRHYRILDRLGFTLQRLDELYAPNGMVGFRGKARTDGKLLVPEAIQLLKNKAAA